MTDIAGLPIGEATLTSWLWLNMEVMGLGTLTTDQLEEAAPQVKRLADKMLQHRNVYTDTTPRKQIIGLQAITPPNAKQFFVDELVFVYRYQDVSLTTFDYLDEIGFTYEGDN